MSDIIKQYETLNEQLNPMYADVLRATDIVKEFIIEHDLIMYGGAAIHMALQLKGSYLYLPGAIADFDFFSPNSVEHSYLLSDKLYSHGWTDARSIVAIFITTMRNDIGDNNFVADIAYLPANIFNKVPTLTYDGMRIVHPLWQLVDVHSALSFPYDNPPIEVLFDRWKKDITRFNMLVDLYPVTSAAQPATIASHLQRALIPKSLRALVWDGVAAYTFIYQQYKHIAESLSLEIPDSVIKHDIEFTDDGVVLHLIDGVFEISHYDVDKCVADYSIRDDVHYDAYGKTFPERAEGIYRENVQHDQLSIRVISTHGKLLSINTIRQSTLTHHAINKDHIDNSDTMYRIVNIQACMKYFLSYHFVCDDAELANVYLAYYCSLLQMVKIGDVVKGTPAEQPWLDSPLSLSVDYYGKLNRNKQTEYILSQVYEQIDNKPPSSKPAPYFPNKHKPHPTFDYASVPSFQIAGMRR